MTYAFHTLLKDKEIIAAEVMNEYNQGVSQLPLLHMPPIKSHV